MPLPEFVDAHHHLWDLEAVHYPWLMARGERRFFGDPTPIQKNYLLDDFLGEPGEYTPVASVHIQVGADDGMAETAWLHAQGSKPEAVVAFVDLAASDMEATLSAQRSHNRVRGIRQIVGRHEEEDSKHGSDSLLTDSRWRAGLKTLEVTGLSFDLQMIPPQMPAVLDAIDSVPDLPVALCHAGSPWDQSPEGLARWRDGLIAFAERPNTVCKISGLGMFNPDWSVDDLKPIVHTVIDVFSPARVMFGSNFPVDKLYRSYADYWDAYDSLTGEFNVAERQAMFADNARRFYRMNG